MMTLGVAETVKYLPAAECKKCFAEHKIIEPSKPYF